MTPLTASIATSDGSSRARHGGNPHGAYKKTVRVIGAIAGGVAPYSWEVDWYDGMTNVGVLSSPGGITPLSHPYIYQYSGAYTNALGDKPIKLTVTDHVGAVVSDEVWFHIMRDHIGFGEWPDTQSPAPESEAEEDNILRGLDAQKCQWNFEGDDGIRKEFPVGNERQSASDKTVNGIVWPGQPWGPRHRIPYRTVTSCRWKGQTKTSFQCANLTSRSIVENRTPPALTIRGHSYPAWTESAQTYIRRQARQYKAWGEPFYFDYHGEPENDWDAQNECYVAMYPGTPAMDQNAYADWWAQAYDVIIRIFREEEVFNCLGFTVRLLGSTYRQHSNGGPENWAARLTERFTFMGCSAYAKLDMNRTFLQSVTQDSTHGLAASAALYGKAVLIGEMGVAKPGPTNPSGLSANWQATWIDTAIGNFESWEGATPVEAFLLNSGNPGDGDYRWDSTGSYLAKLRVLATRPSLSPGWTPPEGSGGVQHTTIAMSGGGSIAVDAHRVTPNGIRMSGGGSIAVVAHEIAHAPILLEGGGQMAVDLHTKTGVSVVLSGGGHIAVHASSGGFDRYFMPPLAPVERIAPRRMPGVPNSPAYRSRFLTWPQGLDITIGLDGTIYPSPAQAPASATTYLGGRWNGPLAPDLRAAITAAGLGARLRGVMPGAEGTLPASIDA